MSKTDFANRREAMVQHQIAHRGVQAPLVLDAMRAVPREAFLPDELRELAYEDTPLQSQEGHPFSAPYFVAMMIAALELKGGETVLEIGTGSGYSSAVLSRIANNVYTVERVGQLAEKAAATLADHGYRNVHVLHGDGTHGWADHAPYDAILVAAGSPAIPQTLEKQLNIGGRLVIPMGTGQEVQEMVRVTRLSETEFKRDHIARL
ncbi:protein-L-isoaspartate(D-aspartate) O-methyltransferase [Thiomonas sp. FB-Cd]|uniref:protein-L-isoaspartate(D-aspartate) O-methyltransferase n=1 Tax=Thiomonas sp. FB-Cd TaxID=1158292 RepID=UPI0006908A6B|nr:protein-L-isoaspartate(D-aspartate) O-methyltransferase [Thiomonas sp. FB-Cd]